jgi:hypothetical protein
MFKIRKGGRKIEKNKEEGEKMRGKKGVAKCCEIDCEEDVFFNFLSSLLFRDLSENQLSGSIPSEFGQQVPLRHWFVISLLFFFIIKRRESERKKKE